MPEKRDGERGQGVRNQGGRCQQARHFDSEDITNVAVRHTWRLDYISTFASTTIQSYMAHDESKVARELRKRSWTDKGRHAECVLRVLCA